MKNEQFRNFSTIFSTASYTKQLENHSRLSSNIIDNPTTKLDVHHRNTYNRTNHNRHHTTKIIGSSHKIDATSSPIVYSSSSSSYERYPVSEPDPYWDQQADNRRFTERRKKTVRFDGQDSDEWLRWESERQGSQDSTTKDSGIDTSSTFTSSEDSNRGDGPKVYPSYTSFFFNSFFLNQNYPKHLNN